MRGHFIKRNFVFEVWCHAFVNVNTMYKETIKIIHGFSNYVFKNPAISTTPNDLRVGDVVPWNC